MGLLLFERAVQTKSPLVESSGWRGRGKKFLIGSCGPIVQSEPRKISSHLRSFYFSQEAFSNARVPRMMSMVDSERREQRVRCQWLVVPDWV